jgi:hypothetical protein
MFLVPGLEQVNVAWVMLQKEGYVLYGFLLYADTDSEIVKFMSDGIFDLDVLSGDECAIFVIESPSEKWITYAKQGNHTWWRLFGKQLAEQTLAEKPSDEKSKWFWQKITLFQQVIIQNNTDANIVVGDDNIVSLAHIIQPRISLLYNRNEAFKVATHFGVDYCELPCLIFFKDLKGRVIWKKQLEQYDSQASLKKFFREFFQSDDFNSMLAASTVEQWN